MAYWKPGPRFGGLLFGLLIIAFGVVWLGNELYGWNITFPLWPFLVLLLGLYLVGASLRNILMR